MWCLSRHLTSEFSSYFEENGPLSPHAMAPSSEGAVSLNPHLKAPVDYVAVIFVAIEFD
jgi:hypothetical protein